MLRFMWLRKTNESGSSATRDDRSQQDPVPQNAAPNRSSASALLSAAQIWSTEDTTSATPNVTEPAAPPPLPTLPEADTAPIVAELIEAATCASQLTAELKPTATEVKITLAAERSLAETIAATPALTPAPRPWPPRKLSLALQGGGTFSAFSWGVLERLLEEPACDFDTISGASAGAINAALLASGLAQGGREGARQLLARFWNRMTNEASFRSLMLLGSFSPASSSISLSPAFRSGHSDPLDLEPLREVLARKIDFDAVRAPSAPRLLLAATRVRDGGQQIFRNAEITPDVLLASTCPPQMHGAVKIDGEAYWDGGYGANPPIISVVHESSAADLLVIQVTPARDGYIPVTPAAIDRRLDQITANAVLNAEIAALEWARSDGLHPPRIHRLAAEDAIDGLAQCDPSDLSRSFIMTLHSQGRAAAERWLSEAPAGTTLVTADRRPAFPSEDALADVLA